MRSVFVLAYGFPVLAACSRTVGPLDAHAADAVTDAPRDAPSGPCALDGDCAARGLVCDPSAGRCVACVTDAQCGADQLCAPGGACQPRACRPGTSECLDAMRARACDARGAGWVETACAASESCAGGRCVARLCTPGEVSCADTGARRVCNPDGQGYIVTPCPSGRSCVMGACSTDTCAPGLADCDGVAANGCESDLNRDPAHCGSCATPCIAGGTCAGGVCGPRLISGLGGPAGFGTGNLPPGDDASSAVIDVTVAFPSGLRYGSAGTFRSLYVNNNGNITFGGPSPSSTTPGMSMIFAWLADVDTRSDGRPARNGIYWDVRPGQFTATWFNVGYFNIHDDRENSFQIVLRDRSDVAAGDFDVELRYGRCEWTTGDSAGGTGGLGGMPAQAGLDWGGGASVLTLPGSGTARVLDLCTTSNIGATGVWRYAVRGGVPR